MISSWLGSAVKASRLDVVQQQRVRRVAGAIAFLVAAVSCSSTTKSKGDDACDGLRAQCPSCSATVKPDCEATSAANDVAACQTMLDDATVKAACTPGGSGGSGGGPQNPACVELAKRCPGCNSAPIKAGCEANVAVDDEIACQSMLDDAELQSRCP